MPGCSCAAGGSRAAGSVNVSAPTILVTNSGQISTLTTGAGGAGDITISADKLEVRARGGELYVLASRDGARAEAYAREHSFAKAHDSYEALLADPDLARAYDDAFQELRARAQE